MIHCVKYRTIAELNDRKYALLGEKIALEYTI